MIILTRKKHYVSGALMYFEIIITILYCVYIDWQRVDGQYLNLCDGGYLLTTFCQTARDIKQFFFSFFFEEKLLEEVLLSKGGYSVIVLQALFKLFQTLEKLTLVLLNPDVSYLCKQYRSRSVGF